MNQRKNILKIYEEIETNRIFGAPEIESIEMFNFNGQECYEKLKEIGFVKEVKGKGKYTFISDFNYVEMKVTKLNQMFKHDTIVNNLDHLKEQR